jgi:hypothetical protein
MVYLQINKVKYDVDWEIMITYEKLKIVGSQFFTNVIMFVYIWSNSNFFLDYKYSDSTCSINGE